MALLFLEGFEGYGARTDLLTTAGSVKWQSFDRYASNTDISLSSSVFRTEQVTAASSRSLYLPYCYQSYPTEAALSLPTLTEVIIGFGIYKTSHELTALLRVGNNTCKSEGICIGLTGAGMMTVSVPNSTSGLPGTILGTSSAGIGTYTWHYIEVRVKNGTTTGEVEIKLDDVQVLNLTGINTATGAPNYKVARFWTGYTNQNIGTPMYLDDVYVADTTGTVNNTFLGPTSVYSLMPTGAGSATQLSVVGAANNWEAVDDTTPDTSTYVQGNTTGNKDYYTFEDLPSSVTSVAGVAMKARSSTPSGVRKILIHLKNATDVLTSTAKTVFVGSWMLDYFISDTAPDGTAWTKAKVDGTEGGFEAN